MAVALCLTMPRTKPRTTTLAGGWALTTFSNACQTGVNSRLCRKLVRQVMGRTLQLRQLQAFRQEIGMSPLSAGALRMLVTYIPHVTHMPRLQLVKA